MSRINKSLKFLIKSGSKLEISFVYAVKPNKGRYSFNFCYNVQRIQGKGQGDSEQVEILCVDLAQFFQKRVLERFFLPYQTNKTRYDFINLRLQSNSIIEKYKFPLTPKLQGSAKDSPMNISGVYNCRCECVDGKYFYYKLKDFSVTPQQNTADFFMNDLIPSVDTFYLLELETQGLKYYFELSYLGKKLISTNSGVIALSETIEYE